MAKLSPEQYANAYRRVSAARASGQTSLACPRCEAMGATFLDQSARPAAEWYAIRCPACGLETTIGVALGG